MSFEDALAFTLRWEGGFVDDPEDPGGATMQGITWETFNSWRTVHGMTSAPVETMSPQERDAIYREFYWDKCKCDILPEPLPIVMFDTAVNLGPKRAIQFLQQAVDDPTVIPDGVFGPKTLNAVAALSQPMLIAVRILSVRATYYGGHTKPKFLVGELNRVNDLRNEIAV